MRRIFAIAFLGVILAGAFPLPAPLCLAEGAKRFPKGLVLPNKDIKAVCDGLRADGRSEGLRKILTRQIDWVTDCQGCKPVMKAIAVNCKGQGKRKSLQPGAPERIRREPSVILLDTVSDVFRNYADAEGEQSIQERTKVVRALGLALEDPTDKTEGERSYFGILASFIKAPFLGRLKTLPAASSATPARPRRPAVDLQSIFE